MQEKDITKNLRVDKKGRISIGKLLSDKTTNLQARLIDNGDIILTPMIEIPISEVWIQKNPSALASVYIGLEQAKNGEITTLDLTELPDEDEYEE